MTGSCRRGPVRSVLLGVGIALLGAGLIRAGGAGAADGVAGDGSERGMGGDGGVEVVVVAAPASAGLAGDADGDGAGSGGGDASEKQEAEEPTMPVPSTVLDLKANLIDGTEKALKDYKGKVLLIVNVASRCGYTRQYEGLEALYREYRERGLVVLGFPANDFGAQEPGTNKEILEFCQSRFDVTFPMFAKVVVTGEAPHPLFARLAAQPEPIGGPPKWNFTKYLVDRRGEIVARFDSRTEPTDEKFVALVRELLEREAPAGE
ncbi:MAG: glutathione peroxidase [Phycisphaerales bacterium]